MRPFRQRLESQDVKCMEMTFSFVSDYGSAPSTDKHETLLHTNRHKCIRKNMHILSNGGNNNSLKNSIWNLSAPELYIIYFLFTICFIFKSTKFLYMHTHIDKKINLKGMFSQYPMSQEKQTFWVGTHGFYDWVHTIKGLPQAFLFFLNSTCLEDTGIVNWQH